MGLVSTLFPRRTVEQIAEGVDKDALLRPLGLHREDPVDPRQMVADSAYYTFLEQAAAADPEALTIPLRAGAAMRCDDYGAFGLAWKSAVDLKGSYERAQRYGQVLTSVSTYELIEIEGGALLHLHREGERRLGLRLSNEATIASIAAISRQVSTRPFSPLAVYFKHRPPSSIAAHEAYFGCPVRFGTDKDAIYLSEETLRTPNRLGDESISTFFDTHLDAELSKLAPDDTLDRRVSAHISQSLSEGVPLISDIARQLGMSGRTLQRRLQERGLSFQTLVDTARYRLAERLLEETDYSPAEVAFMTGFSDQSAFTRAFKRNRHRTPRAHRDLYRRRVS